MLRRARLPICFGIVALLALALPLVASAHEHRTVGNGKYTLIVGFLDEPSFAGLKNGLDLTVETTPPSANQQGKPVTGLEQTLKAEAVFGGQKLTLDLTPRFGDPGAYDGVFFPMKAGDYSFHIYGTIEGTKIDETFTSSPNTFSSVEDPTPYELPKAKPSSSTGRIFGTLDLSGPLGGLGGHMDGLGGLAAVIVVLTGGVGLWSIRRRRAVVRSA